MSGKPILDASKIKHLIGRKVLLDWEERKETLLGGRLVMPETHRTQRQFTGTILALGPDVDPEVSVGDRVFFEQFSNPEVYEDPKRGRICIVDDGALMAIIPKRTKIETEDESYDFNQ